MGFFKDGDLPSLPKSDQDILRKARDRVSGIPEVAITYGSLWPHQFRTRSGYEGGMKKYAVAVIFLCILSSGANARPPTVDVNPGYDRRLEESRKALQASETRKPNIVVKRHRQLK
jgi:hypothetical protein